MSQLFSSFRLRDLEFKNRIWVSPMCQYSSVEGMANDWHLVHLGSRAVGGASLVMVEATAVSPEGRITSGDMGIWSDQHAEALLRITTFLRENGSVPAIQLAHAGRKGATSVPWISAGPTWSTVAPSALPFAEGWQTPSAMDESQIEKVCFDFAQSVRRAEEAGFDVVELHMAHGYLLHEFLSPLSNIRTDRYGGSLENRMRLPLRIVNETRKAWPASKPVVVRISATDWKEGGWDLEQSVVLCRELKALGVDLIDCSSGGLAPHVKIPVGPGYQVQFAQEIRSRVGISTGAVGLINEPSHAEEIIASGQADVVLLARQLLRDPYWPLRAAQALNHHKMPWPKQYERAKPS